MAFLALLVGALLITGLVSRLIRLGFRRSSGMVRSLAPNAITLVIATIVGGYGMADGGPPQFARAFVPYCVACVIWAVFDVVRDGRARRAAAPTT